MNIVLISSIIGGVCYLSHIALKWHTINMICKSEWLTKAHTKYLASMIKQFQYKILS